MLGKIAGFTTEKQLILYHKYPDDIQIMWMSDP